MSATYELGRGIELQRIFDAPPDVVFDCWTKPDLLDWFFNPDNAPEYPTTVDLRVGGQWRQQMFINEETNYVTGGVYKEIEPNSRLSFYWGAIGGWPEMDIGKPEASPLASIRLTQRGAQTVMDFQLQLPDSYSEETTEWWMNCGMIAGWNMTIDRLVEQLNGESSDRLAG